MCVPIIKWTVAKMWCEEDTALRDMACGSFVCTTVEIGRDPMISCTAVKAGAMIG